MNHPFHNTLLANKFSQDFHPIVSFDAGNDTIAALDLSPANKNFTAEDYASTAALQAFINKRIAESNARYLIGGYSEMRNMYLRSRHFDENITDDASMVEEPRNIHLGIDVWAEAGTPVFAPLGGMVHSMAYNNHFGDYGPTIILQHQIDMFNFYTLYGHLSVTDLRNNRVGQFVTRGECFGHFGPAPENGDWPPHLHFQIIVEINEWEGDYPGVCKVSEMPKYLANSPDADLILGMRKYVRRV